MGAAPPGECLAETIVDHLLDSETIEGVAILGLAAGLIADDASVLDPCRMRRAFPDRPSAHRKGIRSGEIRAHF